MKLKIGNAEKADGDRAHQTQNHPGHADAPRRLDLGKRARRHEAHQNVRLPEVTQTPGHQRNDRNHVEVAQHVGVQRIQTVNQFNAGCYAVACGNHHHRHK